MKKSIKIYLNPTVLTLGLISFFADVATEMLYPITPIFLTTVLGASMTYVGIIEGIAEALSSLLKSYSGIWSDAIYRRKPFILLGYGLSAIAKPMTGLAHSWGMVLLARSLDRTGKGFRTAPRDALLADAVCPEQRGEAFGWHRLMDTLGAVTGPLLAIFLLSIYQHDLRSIFFWSFVPGLISIIYVLNIKEKKITFPKLQTTKMNFENTPSAFKAFMFVWTIFSLGNSSDVFLLMRAKSMGINTTSVILLYCFYNLVYALLSPYLGRLSDNVGRKKCLLFGLALFSFVYLGFAFVTSLGQLIFLFGIYGAYMAATDGVAKAYAIELFDSNKKASAVGLLGTFTGLSALFASIASGILWDHFSQHAPFFLGFLLSLVAFLVLSFSKKLKTE